MAKDLIFLAAAYLFGAIPFGLVIGKLYGKDIRKEGSCNIGATNVTRVVGKTAGKICFALDFAKGFLPVCLAAKYGGAFTPLLAGAGAILGHIFPVYLKFRGGKGVATAGGVAAALSPLGFAASFILWGVVFFASGYVSLASIVAAAALPVLAFVFSRLGWGHPLSLYSLLFLIAVAVLAIYKHRANIKRLLEGSESNFRRKGPKQ